MVKCQCLIYPFFHIESSGLPQGTILDPQILMNFGGLRWQDSAWLIVEMFRYWQWSIWRFVFTVIVQAQPLKRVTSGGDAVVTVEGTSKKVSFRLELYLVLRR